MDLKKYLWVAKFSEIDEWGIIKGNSLDDMVEVQLKKLNKISFFGVSPIETVGDLKRIYKEYLPERSPDFQTEVKNSDKLTLKAKKDLILLLLREGTIEFKRKKCKFINIFDVTDSSNISLVGYYNYI